MAAAAPSSVSSSESSIGFALIAADASAALDACCASSRAGELGGSDSSIQTLYCRTNANIGFGADGATLSARNPLPQALD